MKTPPLALDFQRPSERAPRWAAWLLLACAAALAAWAADRHAALQERVDTLESRNRALDARLRPARAAGPAATSPEGVRRLRQANTVIERLTLPWDRLFAAVEAADTRGLALLALEPNARDLTLRLSGEVRSVDDLLAYVDRLGRQRSLAQVHVVSFDTVDREGTPVIAFTLSARWLPS